MAKMHSICKQDPLSTLHRMMESGNLIKENKCRVPGIAEFFWFTGESYLILPLNLNST